MKGFPKVLKTKEDYYNCLAMVASGELAAADLLAKIESAENQRYIECGVAAVEEEKKAVTVYYCDEAAVGMKFVAGDVSGTVQGVTHIQTDEAAAAGEAGNDRTALTLSKAVKAGCKVIALERTDTVAGMTTDLIFNIYNDFHNISKTHVSELISDSFKYSVKIFDISKSEIITDVLDIQIRKMQKGTGIKYLSHFLKLKKSITTPPHNFTIQCYLCHPCRFGILFHWYCFACIQQHPLNNIPYTVFFGILFFLSLHSVSAVQCM